MKIGAVIQARMGSTRLPGKSLMAVWNGMGLLEMVLRRVLAAREPDEVVLATSEDANCDPLQTLAESLGIAVVRGSETDVLGRFVTAARQHGLDAIIRVCADNPLVSPEELDRLAAAFRAAPCDYMNNNTPESGLPDGLGAEIVLSRLLIQHWPEADELSREHVTEFILQFPRNFHCEPCPAPQDMHMPEARLDIDTREDLEAMRTFTAALPPDVGPLWTNGQILKALRDAKGHEQA